VGGTEPSCVSLKGRDGLAEAASLRFQFGQIVSSVNGGSSHCVVGLAHTRLSMSRRPLGISDSGRVYTDTSPSPSRVLSSVESMDLARKVGGSE